MNAASLLLKRKLLNLFTILLLVFLLVLSYDSFAVSNSSASCGQGLELDGINDWINIPDYTLVNDFTLEGWFKLAPNINDRNVLFGQEGSGPNIHFTQGKVRLYAEGIRATANTPLADNSWGHIAITRSGKNLRIYINGVEDFVKGDLSGSLSIKAIGRGNRGYFKGMIDEVRIWNIARTESEIASHFNTEVNPGSTGLIGYWNFNENDQIITDVSNSENHASLGSNTDVGTDDPVRINFSAPMTESCDEDKTGRTFNEAPVANDDTVDPVVAGGTINFSVTGNDEDIDGNLDRTTVEIVSAPSDGTAIVDAFGIITYFNTGTTALTDELKYTVIDTEGIISNEATVTITVTEPPLTNDKPDAQADTAIIQSGDTVTINVLANDGDNDGSLNKTHLFIVREPNFGTAVIDYDTGEITYTHDGSFIINDRFIYRIEDNQGAVSDEATVSITINSSSTNSEKNVEFAGHSLKYNSLDVDIDKNYDDGETGSNTNVAPVANADTVGPVVTGKTISFSVTKNDVDSDDNLNPLSVVIISPPKDGMATVNSTGTITYLNTGNTSIIDTLSYAVTDSSGVVSNEAKVSITVIEPTHYNVIPIAQVNTAIVFSGKTNH